MDNLYNNENSKDKNLLEDLKNLPKINAPENFEFNLMTRIQNKNFGIVEDERPKFNLIKFFAPSAAVAVIIIMFFVFYPQGEQIQKQIANQNTIGDSQSIVSNSLTQQKELNDKSVHSSRKIESNRVAGSPAAGANQNQVQINRIPVPLNSRRAVSVDDYISGEKSNVGNSQGNIVNSGDQPIQNGFFIEKKTDKETLEKYRDSLKRAQQIADSLKRVQK